jgi:methylglutaconyl-CoA hydratase
MAMVRVEDVGGVRLVTMNRPERKNALVPAMMEELIAAFEGAEAAGARVVVLAGEGGAFCAGLDISLLAEIKDRDAEKHRMEAERVARMFAAVWECDVPTMALVRGAAVAGGTGLAMLCDFTIACPDAVFGFTEARVGFVPALVGAYLPEVVSGKAARELLLSARKIHAEEARRVGFVNEVVAHGLQNRAKEIIAELVANSPESLRATKRMLRAMAKERLDRAVELAIEVHGKARETADFGEGVTAFMEKRKPVWQGRG